MPTSAAPRNVRWWILSENEPQSAPAASEIACTVSAGCGHYAVWRLLPIVGSRPR